MVFKVSSNSNHYNDSMICILLQKQYLLQSAPFSSEVGSVRKHKLLQGSDIYLAKAFYVESNLKGMEVHQLMVADSAANKVAFVEVRTKNLLIKIYGQMGLSYQML